MMPTTLVKISPAPPPNTLTTINNDNNTAKNNENEINSANKRSKNPDIYQEYFSKLNPIAMKISHDIDETKSAYEHIWNELQPNEQIEIINEILIKPEISLRYFDNFSSTPSSSSLTSTSSNSVLSLIQDDYPPLIITASSSGGTGTGSNVIGLQSNSTTTASTTMITIASNESSNNGLITLIPNILKTQTLKSIASQNDNYYKKLNTKNIYQYNGKTLSSFCQQKTGLKIINDEILGVFRDEHSMPFSVKTKSQINLRIFDEQPETKISIYKEKENHMPSASTLIKFQKLNAELTASINQKSRNDSSVLQKKESIKSNNSIEKFDNSSSSNNGKYERFYNNKSNINKDSIGTSNIQSDDNYKTNFLTKFIGKNNLIFNTNGSKQQSSLQSNHNSGSISGADTTNLKLMSDDLDDIKLMENINYNKYGESVANISSSSENSMMQLTVPININDEYREDDDDDKTDIREDSKLLLDNDSLRKGFDFLNNW